MIFDLDSTPPDIGFPETRLAETDPNGLLAIGGDLSSERLVNAYRRGIFPWFSKGQPILWWSPAPRMVLFADEFHLSRSLRKTLRRQPFDVSLNQAFEQTISACAAPRDQDGGTWLLPEMIESYAALHAAGIAHSIEVWHHDELVGGLYGIALGRIFFGESMFSRRNDASKIALVLLVELARRRPFEMIDCQVYTEHLARLGAREIGRDRFEEILETSVNKKAAPLSPMVRFPIANLEHAT